MLSQATTFTIPQFNFWIDLLIYVADVICFYMFLDVFGHLFYTAIV